MSARKALFRGAAVSPGLLVFAAAAGAAPVATPPPNCNAAFNAYAYTQQALSSCTNIRTFPQSAVKGMPGGGTETDYNVDGVLYQYFTPPAGFNPSTATDAQLKEYGLPPRPADASGQAAWDASVGKASATNPAPFLTELPGVSADTVNLANWSGYAVSGANGTYNQSSSEWYEPQYGSSVCSGASAVIWDGIGGYGGGTLGQDGTLYNVPGASNHGAWSEVYPNQNIVPQFLLSTPGSQFIAETQWTGSAWHFYMQDTASGNSLSYNVNINAYSGQSAEAIGERPTINGSLSPLANFGTLSFTKSTANGTSLDQYSPSGVRHGVHMYNSGTGHYLAEPGNIGSNGAFADQQEHCI
ncbi:MAG TPA: G1 family glutamic endopeptidase [Solirubrobacteraceae bacterium]|nr:G1 family glutamic endopeptidase [Solirubrobacteraceae bacterium]